MSAFYAAEATSYKNNLVHYVAKQKNKIPKGYTAPESAQVDLMREAIRFILAEDFAGADRAAGAIGYTLRAITSTNNLTYYILESSDPKHRPWGTYIFYLGSGKGDFVIEVPHPAEEKNTSKIGIMAFECTDSETKPVAFLLSGSRKGAGDVTLDASSIFQAVHEEAASETTTIVLQIHGFNRKRYPQIVLTSGTPVAIPAMDNLVDKLIQNDFEVGIYDGVQYADVGSTQNEQAKYTNSIGGSFIGIFLNQAVHNSKKQSGRVIDSIEEYVESETPETP